MSQKPAKNESSGNNYGVHIGGSVTVGGDMVTGNQYKYINQDNHQVQIGTPAEFVAELKKLQDQIAALKQSPDLDEGDLQTIKIVESRVEEAAAEAQKEKPAGERIKTALEKAKKTMDVVAGSITSAVALGTALAGLATIALKLFGG